MATVNAPRPPSSSTAPSTAATATAPSSSSSRPPPIQPPPLTIDPTAFVADKATLTGTHRITIHARAIIHPFARLDSSTAELEIGEACTVWEKAVVGATRPTSPPSSSSSAAAPTSTSTSTSRPASVAASDLPNADADASAEKEASSGAAAKPTSIGAHCTISPHASVGASATIGAHTTVEVGARIGSGCIVGEHCRLAPTTSLDATDPSMEDFTVLFYGPGAGGAGGLQRRRIDVSLRDFERARELQGEGREKAREYVAKIVKGSAAAGKWR